MYGIPQEHARVAASALRSLGPNESEPGDDTTLIAPSATEIWESQTEPDWDDPRVRAMYAITPDSRAVREISPGATVGESETERDDNAPLVAPAIPSANSGSVDRSVASFGIDMGEVVPVRFVSCYSRTFTFLI